MAKHHEKTKWERIQVLVSVFTGKWIPNPAQDVKVIPWQGWGAYGIQAHPIKLEGTSDHQAE